MTTMQTTIASPVGPLALTVDDDGALTRLGFGAGETSDDPRFEPAIAQLREYFAGERTGFDLDLRPEGGTASGTRARRAPSGAPTAATPSRSSARATASSAAMAR
jgi:methylated-DNA-[protein]-cysteine S-methyltransferase